MLSLMKGEPLVAKLAAIARYGVLPAAMIAALVYSPPDYSTSSDKKKKQQLQSTTN